MTAHIQTRLAWGFGIFSSSHKTTRHGDLAGLVTYCHDKTYHANDIAAVLRYDAAYSNKACELVITREEL